MSRKVLVSGIFIAVVLGLVGAFASSATQNQEGGAAARAARAPRNQAEFNEMFDKVSNWGRWGKDDELGSANLLTDAKRKQAASLVKSGVSVSLAHNPLTEKAEDNPQPYEVTVAVPKPDAIGTGDTFRISYHGYAHSHLDALCHIFHKGMMYNGVPNSVVTAAGCGKSGIQGLKNGIVTRGILIDIPRLKRRAVPRTGNAGVSGRRGGMGEEGGHQGLVGRRDLLEDGALGKTCQGRPLGDCQPGGWLSRVDRAVAQGAQRGHAGQRCSGRCHAVSG